MPRPNPLGSGNGAAAWLVMQRAWIGHPRRGVVRQGSAQTSRPGHSRNRARHVMAPTARSGDDPRGCRHDPRCLSRDCCALEAVRGHMHDFADHRSAVSQRVAVNQRRKTAVGKLGTPDFSGLALMIAPCRVAVSWRVDDVDALDIFGPGLIPGRVGFAWRQRKPTDGRFATGCGPGIFDIFEESDQRRRINRVLHAAAWHPGPALVDMDPAPEMKRREAPRLVVDPRPTPRFDRCPMAEPVGRPIRRDRSGKPDRTVIVALLPAAIGIEPLVAGHLTRDVLGGLRLLGVVFRSHRPREKFVRRRLRSVCG